jgi:hypothetical protein
MPKKKRVSGPLEALAALSGKTVEEMRADWAAREQLKHDLNRQLQQPARRKCFIQVTVSASVEVDTDDCGTDDGKRRLFEKAMNSFEDATGVRANDEADDIKIDVSDGNRSSVFELELSDSTREFVRGRTPNAPARDCIKTSYRYPNA